MQKKRVILDTDIGDDIDDAYALSFLLSSPEVQLDGVCTVHGAVEARARIALKLLRQAGREDVPVIIGLAGPGDAQALPNQAPWAQEMDGGNCRRDFVEFMAEAAAASPGEVHLLAIGPLTNVGCIFRQRPETAKMLAGLIVMGGSVYRGYGGKDAPQAEYNIRCDPEAARAVLESGADITLVPLDATAALELSDEQLRRIAHSEAPLAKAMTELLPLWRAHSGHNPILYDPFTAALLIDPSLGRLKKMGIQVTDEGMTRPAQTSRSSARVCVESDAERFFEFLMSRLIGSATQRRS